MTKLIVKLLCKVCVTFSVDNIIDSSICHQLGFTLSLILSNVLFSLLIYSLLMKHIVSAILISRTHKPWSIIDLWRKQPLSRRCTVIMLPLANDIARRIQKRYLAPAHVPHVLVIRRRQVARPTAIRPIIICYTTCRLVFHAVVISLQEVVVRGRLAQRPTRITQNLFAARVGELLDLHLLFFFLFFVAQLWQIVLFLGNKSLLRFKESLSLARSDFVVVFSGLVGDFNPGTKGALLHHLFRL